MKLKRIITITLILICLFTLITTVNATDNITDTVQSTDENMMNNMPQEHVLSQNNKDQPLTQDNNEKEVLNSFVPAGISNTITVNDTSDFESTGNITINMHFSFTAVQHDGEFENQKINLYENNTLIKTFTVKDLNLPELGIVTGREINSYIAYQADFLFNYTLKDNTYLTTSILGTYSNSLQFEKIKNTQYYTLNNNQILIDYTPISNETWTNSIESLKKAIQQASNNGIIYLNNINLIHDIDETFIIDKNITVMGNNATITLKGKQILFQINNNINFKLKNITFIQNKDYVIDNYGNTEINDCIFKENTEGLFKNNGYLKINNTLIYNNINILPYNHQIEKTDYPSLIYNNKELKIDNTNFTNINNIIVINMGDLKLNHTLINNTQPQSNIIYKTINNKQIVNNYIYSSYSRKNAPTITYGIIHNSNNTIIENTILSNINNNYGLIHNTETIIINNATFKQISTTEGVIYNTGTAIINNTLITQITGSKRFNQTYPQIVTGSDVIYNNNIMNISNSIINSSSGRAIDNEGNFNLYNTTVTQTTGIYNNNQLNLTKLTYISNNKGTVYDFLQGESGYTTGVFYYFHIYNTENGYALIDHSTFKDNELTRGNNANWGVYGGVISNDGVMDVFSNIFDNNHPSDWNWLAGGDGTLNIINSGTISIFYNYLLNTQYYNGYAHSPVGFYYGLGGRANINYNYFCIDNVITRANKNYYFTPEFDDYYPIKTNQSANITLQLVLTNGMDTIEFNDWDKLPNAGLNTTITTIMNGEWINFTTILKTKYSFIFNETKDKNQYNITANIAGKITTALVDVGKEFAEMTVTYNNITYNDKGNVTFNITVKGNNTPLNGTITLTFQNKKTILELENGSCTYTIPSTLIPDTYTVKITYEGNENYFKIRNQLYNFTIYKLPTNLTVSGNTDLKIGESGKITITPSTRMEIDIYDNGKLLRTVNVDQTKTFNLAKLSHGLHNITLKFKGDTYYSECEAVIWINVTLYETSLTVNTSNIYAGENATINITINPGDVRGEAIIEINNQTSSIFLDNTSTLITIENLTYGEYNITVIYPGDNKYYSSNASTTLNVLRKTSNLTVNITQNNFSGNIEVKTDYPDCTGEIGLYINNNLQILNLTHGECNFSVKFARGTNYIYILYLGDDYYESASWNTTLNIEGTPVITSDNITCEEYTNFNYTFTIKDTENNPFEYTNVTLSINNENYTLTTNGDGIATHQLNLPVGTYNITITCKNTTLTNTIIIKPAKMNVYIKDILAGEIETITVTLPENATGNIKFQIDNTTYTETLKQGTASIDIENLKLGGHELKITYTSTGKYTNQTFNTTFYIKNTLSWIEITSNNITYGDDLIINIKVINEASGNITITIDNQTQTVPVNTSQVIFKNISAGEKTVTARYNGDEIYQSSNDAISIKINKATPTITVITSDLILNKNIEITALINPDATGNITYRILGLYSPRNKTVINGSTSWLISPLESGSYNLVVIYNGDDNYNNKTISEILIINQTKTLLTVSISNINADEDLIVFATLCDENNKPVTGNVTLGINSEYYNIIIINGTGSRNLGEFNTGIYSFTAMYDGTTNLSKAQTTGSFKINTNKYQITASNVQVYYGDTVTYTIKITNNNKLINGTATVTVNNQNMKINIKNGYATIKIKLNKGTYSITTKIANTKITKKITVNQPLVFKKYTIKKHLKTNKIQIQLKGKNIKNKKLTLKIAGKSIKAKTNKKGIATFKINNKILKKLKTNKKYKITAKYQTVQLSKKIKIKK